MTRRLLSPRMAYRNVRTRLGRMALSVVAIALGVALVVAVRLMNATVLHAFLDTMDATAGRAQLSISVGDGLSFPESVLDEAAAVPGVRLAVPVVRAVAFPDDKSGELLSVFGVDLTNDAAVRLYQTEGADGVVDDLVSFLNHPHALVLGRNFAERRGLKVGDTLRLATPTGVVPFTIDGLLEPEGIAKTLDGRLVVLDLFSAQRAFTSPGQITQIDLLLEPGANPDAVRASLERVVPPGLSVAEPSLRKDLLERTVGGFQAMLTAFSLLAVLAGFVICYGRLSAIFEARVWEVGVWRAIGVRQRAVVAELLKESLLLGIAGTALGLVLGIAIGRAGLPFIATATALNFRLPPPSTEPILPVTAILWGSLVGVSAAILAALRPALHLSRAEPVFALSFRGRELPMSNQWTWTVPAAIAGSTGALLGWQIHAPNVALGNITTALLAVAIALSAAPLVASGGGRLAAVWRLVAGPAGAFAATRLSRQPRRSALSVATLGLGLGAVLMFGMLGWSFEQTLVSRLSSRFRTDLIVASAFVSGGYRQSPVSENLVARLREVPGIRVAVGNQGQDVPYEGGSVVIDSYDPEGFSDPTVFVWPLDSDALPEALERVAKGEAVMLSTAFAHQHGVRPGQRITLQPPGGPATFLVAAVTEGQVENAVLMVRSVYRRLWNDNRVYQVHVVVDDAVGPAAVRQTIEQTLATEYRLQVRSSDELVAFLADQVRSAFSALYLMEAVIFLLVLVGVGDTLATSVLERIREIGMMRALGLSRLQLLRMVVLEGASLGILGIALAIAGGMALGAFWVKVQFPAVLGWDLHLHVPWSFAAAASAFAVGLCLLASILPAVRASRLAVNAALRTE